jgi:ligand-binding SRPBCC domain-containing protein
MSQRLLTEYWIPVPLPRVFAFFSDPHNLPRVMPPSRGAKILKLNLVPPRLPQEQRAHGFERMAGAGTEIHLKIRALPYLPIHERWIALITEFSYNEYFSDVQKQGPFKRWHHTHTFEAQSQNGREGTLVGDEVEYEVGFGLVGNLLEKLIFRGMMNSMFEYRRHALRRVFATEFSAAQHTPE